MDLLFRFGKIKQYVIMSQLMDKGGKILFNVLKVVTIREGEGIKILLKNLNTKRHDSH